MAKKKRSSLHPFGILRESWDFMRKQPVFIHITLWLLVLPSVIQSIVDYVWPVSALPKIEHIGRVGYVITMLVCTLVLYWGQAAVLVVARRIVSSKAGRSRTSFAAVRKQSSVIVFPLIVTDILQTIIMLEWLLIPFAAGLVYLLFQPVCASALNAYFSDPNTVSPETLTVCAPALALTPLLLLPVWYVLRTMFAPILVATEGLRSRDALRESSRILKGSLRRVSVSLVSILLVLMLPVMAVSFAVESFLTSPLQAQIAAAVFTGCFAVMGCLFSIALVVTFTRLRKTGHRQILPDA